MNWENSRKRTSVGNWVNVNSLAGMSIQWCGETLLTACMMVMAAGSIWAQGGIPKAVLNERGDAGASVAEPVKAPVAQPSRSSVDFPLKLRSSIHVLGGGVRGFGILARYADGGPQSIQIRRVTSFPKFEPYTPITLVRVIDPTGKTIVVKELTDHKSKDKTQTITVPKGQAGIWRVSVSGGRQFDKFEIGLPATKVWGIRGEMSLVIEKGTPNPAYLYLPPSTAQMSIQCLGNNKAKFEVFDESGKSLGTPTRYKGRNARWALQLNSPPRGTVIKLVFKPVNASRVILIDGVPGLLCPSPEVARELKGGAIKVDGLWVAGPLQARARKWLLAQTAKELAVKIRNPDFKVEDIKFPAAEAQLVGALSTLPETLKKQNLDKNDPYFGSPLKQAAGELTWNSFHYRLEGPWDIITPAIAGAVPSPINPYYRDPAVIRRAGLAALSKVAALQGDDLLRASFLGINGSYPITHAFFTYGALAENYEVIKDVLPPELNMIWRDAIIAIGDKLADNQGFESNQWTHNLRGHISTFRATGERRFLGYFERQIKAYLGCVWGPNSKFGQHPAGYYLEQYGCDGNYGNMNLTSIVKFYYKYKDLKEAKPELVAELKKSIENNLHFKSFFWASDSTGSPLSPTAFNSRKPKSSLARSNPEGDYTAYREFDLGQTRASLTHMPKKGTFPASVFSYYAVTKEWGKRILETFLETGKGVKYPERSFMRKIYMLPQTAKIIKIPCEEKSGYWTLPGFFAMKRNGIYVTCFHDIAGTAKNRKLLGFMGGGPTEVWTKSTGPVFISMSPLSDHNNTIKSADNITFSCVFAEGTGGKIVFSGKERSSGEWLTKGKSFSVKEDVLGGHLNWTYAISDSGLSIRISLKGAETKNVLVNLPILSQEGISIKQLSPGKILLMRGSRKEVLISAPVDSFLTGELKRGKRTPVRCLRIPLPENGSPVEIQVTCLNKQ